MSDPRFPSVLHAPLVVITLLAACAPALGDVTLSGRLVDSGGVRYSGERADFAISVSPPSTPPPAFECRIDGGSWAPCATTLTLPGLARGPHTLEARSATSGVPDPSPPSIAWVADLDPPRGLAAVAPSSGSVVDTAFPQFTWVGGSEPAGESGAATASVEVDGALHCTPEVPGGTSCAVPARFRPYPDLGLRNGIHTYRVVQADLVGNRSVTADLPFRVEVPPAARLHVPAHLSGRSTLLDARASVVNSAAEPTFAWDLDGNGTFETRTGTNGVAARAFRAGRHIARVRVTDDAGLTATVSASFTTLPSPPRGRVGVTINGGSFFARSTHVALTPVWPAFAAAMAVANGDGARVTRRLPVRRSVAWRLDPAAPDGVPQTVLVRFTGAPAELQPAPFDQARVHRASIVLDRAAPLVIAATLTGSRPVALKTTVLDTVSGAAAVRIASARGGPGPWRRYRPSIALRGTPGVVRFQVRDRAGNLTRWLTARG